ncbi:MAG: DEAD/DEAH box helicase family protein [Phycisphaeraceae bacterium]
MPSFFDSPILNSPYDYPGQHWELDEAGQPTSRILNERRRADFITPIPKAKRQGKKKSKQAAIVFDEATQVGSDGQKYEKTAQTINALRQRVDAWRAEPDPNSWGVTPETARLLQHWRSHPFTDIRPFFCQIEAVETAIWLTEVAPNRPAEKRTFIDYLDDANESANPDLPRLALKLATGAGKTTVMAMLIAWQTINAVRRPNRKNFTRGFLVVAPGITIKDRLRVLQPNDPDSYYKTRELVPTDMLPDLLKAQIVITNYHAFKLREQTDVSKGTRAAIEGWRGESMQTTETEGQMLQRVMPELMGMKNVVVLNDEAHHCYREKPGDPDEEADLKGDDKAEAETNAKAARLWINGLEAVKQKLGIRRIFDLSATPFFLRGSGYAEGTLFPWTMSDFSLMDAIECGIVKLPRVPVADNSILKKHNYTQSDMPMFRVLWEHIGKHMPKGNRTTTKGLTPEKLETPLITALDALHGHYAKTFDLWQQEGIKSPPCFIIVCNNTASSKLIYDFVAGYVKVNEDGLGVPVPGAFEHFRNHDEHGNPLARPRTLLIDSEQLESGDALDSNFRKIAATEIEQFRKEIIERTGNRAEADRIINDDAAVLREVMNTVGKPGRLGGDIRCVVSVSMLTEGWDANTVTHILGVRAFKTQLLCEQVIGRALRRQSYELNEEGLFNVEYADILGIPFDFTAKPVVAPPQKPRETIHVKAVRPERDHLEVTFPRVQGYRVELPDDRLEAEFTDNSTYELTPEDIGPSITENQGIIGEGVSLDLGHTEDLRRSTILLRLTNHLMRSKFRDGDGDIKIHLFGDLKRITRQWLDHHLVCRGNTYPAQILYPQMADIACNRINDAIVKRFAGERAVKAVLDPYVPSGTTAAVNFNTSKTERYDTSGPPPKCHVNWVVLDSDWEAEFCRVAEAHPRVHSYVKNHNLGFEVPYLGPRPQEVPPGLHRPHRRRPR